MKSSIFFIFYSFYIISNTSGQKLFQPKSFSTSFFRANDPTSNWPWCFVESSDSLLQNDSWSSFILRENGTTTRAQDLWGEDFKGQISPVNGEFNGGRYFIVDKTRLYMVDRNLKVEHIATPLINQFFKYSYEIPYIKDRYLFFSHESDDGNKLISLDSLTRAPRSFGFSASAFIRIDNSLTLAMNPSKFGFFDNQFNEKQISAPVYLSINWRGEERLVYEPDSIFRPFGYEKKDSSGLWRRLKQGTFRFDYSNNFIFKHLNETTYYDLYNGKLVASILDGNLLQTRDGVFEYGFTQTFACFTYEESYQNNFYQIDHSNGKKKIWPLFGSVALKSVGGVWAFDGKVFANFSSETEGREQLFRFYPSNGSWVKVSNFDFDRYSGVNKVTLLGSKMIVSANAYRGKDRAVFMYDSNRVAPFAKSNLWSRLLSPPLVNNPSWPDGGPAILMGMDVSKNGEIAVVNQVSNNCDLFWQGCDLDSFQISKSTISQPPNWADGGQIITLFGKDKRIKWTKTLSGYYYARRSGIKFTNQGKIALAGWNFPFTVIDTIKIESRWGTIAYMAQFDSTGKTEWVLPIKAESAKASELTTDLSGNLYSVIEANGSGTIGNLSFSSKVSKPAFYLVKVNPAGKPLWVKELNIKKGFTYIQFGKIDFNIKFNQVNVLLQEICQGCFGYEFDSTTQCRIFGYDASSGEQIWERSLTSFEAGLSISGFKVSDKGALHILGAGAGLLKMDERPIIQFEKPKFEIQPFWIRLNPYGAENEINAIAIPSLLPWEFDVDENEAIVLLGSKEENGDNSMQYLYLNQKGEILEKRKFPTPNGNDFWNSNPSIFISPQKEIVIGDFYKRGYSGIPHCFDSGFNKSILFGFPFESKSQPLTFSESKESFLIFPNPGAGIGKLFLNYYKFEKLDIDVFTLEGKKVYSFKLNYQEEDFYSFDLKLLSNGLYFIRINSSNPFSTLKFIKN